MAVADVDSRVPDGSALDGHARHNTTSVYTAAQIFPMLPERLSTDLTSLNEDEDRAALVADMVIDEDGELSGSEVYRAAVRNHAKLAYRAVGAALEGQAPMPGRAGASPELGGQLRMQDAAAQKLRRLRYERGALELETIEPRALFDGDQIVDLEVEAKNRARELIEDFMIAANGVTARFLADEGHRFAAPRRPLARAVAAHREGGGGERREASRRSPTARPSRSSWRAAAVRTRCVSRTCRS